MILAQQHNIYYEQKNIHSDDTFIQDRQQNYKINKNCHKAKSQALAVPLFCKGIVLLQVHRKINKSNKSKQFYKNQTLKISKIELNNTMRNAILRWKFEASKQTIVKQALNKVLCQQKIQIQSFFYRLKNIVIQDQKLIKEKSNDLLNQEANKVSKESSKQKNNTKLKRNQMNMVLLKSKYNDETKSSNQQILFEQQSIKPTVQNKVNQITPKGSIQKVNQNLLKNRKILISGLKNQILTEILTVNQLIQKVREIKQFSLQKQ